MSVVACRHCLVAVAFCAVAILTGAGSRKALGASTVIEVRDVLGLYDQGRYGEFDRYQITQRPDFDDGFSAPALQWLREQNDPRRVRVAAAVALELGQRLRDEAPDRAANYFVWASALMREHPAGTSESLDRAWYLASVSAMQDSNEPWALASRQPSLWPKIRRLQDRLPEGGQLAEALRRFPSDPVLRLNQIDGLVSDHSNHGLSAFDMGFVPSVLTFFSGVAEAKVTSQPMSERDLDDMSHKVSAGRLLALRSRISDFVTQLKVLAAADEVKTDVAVRVGYLMGASQQWEQALRILNDASSQTTEPFLVYVAQYTAGRIYRATNDWRRARSAFEAAHTAVPEGRSALVQLAALLMISDDSSDRERADAVADRALVAEWNRDPIVLFARGDAWRWPRRISLVRSELRR